MRRQADFSDVQRELAAMLSRGERRRSLRDRYRWGPVDWLMFGILPVVVLLTGLGHVLGWGAP